MTVKEKTHYYLTVAAEKDIQHRAVWIALGIGILLNIINHPGIILRFSFDDVHAGRALLTFLVPYLVASWSSVHALTTVKPGKVSRITGDLACKSCGKTKYHVRVGDEIAQCPVCKDKTRWELTRITAAGESEDEILESLALFARYNPQPLFRVDARGIILDSNRASEEMLETRAPEGEPLAAFLPDFTEVDFRNIIAEAGEMRLTTLVNDRYYNLVMKGVPALGSVHIYGNDVTEIKKAEQKIRAQAKSIDESIRYSWYIQKAMLPSDRLLSTVFPSSFVFFRPRDIVSGDFYWVNRTGHLKIAAVADCTGHGVPGAMISMMGISLLNEIILRDKVSEPDRILNVLRERLISSLSVFDHSEGLSDGMDIALTVIDTTTDTVHYAGAYNSLVICRDDGLLILKADRMPVGKHFREEKPFTCRSEKLKKGDRLFLYSDGYQDQFGGNDQKKFSSRALFSLMEKVHHLPMNSAYKKFEATFDAWKQNTEQIDDVTVMCIAWPV